MCSFSSTSGGELDDGSHLRLTEASIVVTRAVNFYLCEQKRPPRLARGEHKAGLHCRHPLKEQFVQRLARGSTKAGLATQAPLIQ